MARVIHYFVPHKSNNHKPFITRHPGLATVLLFALAIQTTLNVFLSTRPQILGFATSIYKQEIINLTNSQRSTGGLGTVKHNSMLDEAARLKALDMFANDYWAHVSPTGVDPWSWFRAVGYSYSAAGENLARDFDTSAGVVSAWMASPSHRENIMYPSFTEIGVAVVDGNLNGEDTTLVVQLFATPASAPPVEIKPIVNEPDPVPTVKTTQIPPTAVPTKVVVQPTQVPYIPVTPTTVPVIQPTTSLTLSPTMSPTPTATPTPGIALNNGSNTSYGTAAGVTYQSPDEFQTNLAVLKNLSSFSVGRMFSIVLILALMTLLLSESAILWYKGISHPHAQRMVHVGILFLTLLGTLYGAGGAIL